MPGPGLHPSSLLPALSCPLLRPEEMERAGGGPLSSHPPPSLNQECDPSTPRAQAWEEGGGAGEVPGAAARNLGPSALPTKVPSPVTRSLSPTAFPAIVLEKKKKKTESHPGWPCPCSRHVVLPLPGGAASWPPGTIQAGSRWRDFPVLTALPLARLREVPGLAKVTQLGRGRRI